MSATVGRSRAELRWNARSSRSTSRRAQPITTGHNVTTEWEQRLNLGSRCLRAFVRHSLSPWWANQRLLANNVCTMHLRPRIENKTPRSPLRHRTGSPRCLSMLAGLSPMAYTPSPMVVRAPTRAVAPVMETLDDLKALAPKLNPVVGYYNP
eukprot:scaffold30970_cov69-Phaeocystis_antarctica.AAC.2